MRFLKLTVFFLLIIVISSCTSLVLKPVDYSWPIESVVTVDKDYKVSETRYSFSCNVRDLLVNEYGPNNSAEEISLRIIRDQAGYYYITGEGFRNIYVFEESEAALSLVTKINLPGVDNFQNPVFNQRIPYVEFISGNDKFLLNKDGVVR